MTEQLEGMDQYWKNHPQIGPMIKIANNVGMPQSVGKHQNVGKGQKVVTPQNLDKPLDLRVRKKHSASPTSDPELVALEELAAEVAYQVLEA